MLNRISLSMLVAALFMLPPSAEAASAVAPVAQAENVEQAITAFLQSEMQERKIPGLQIDRKSTRLNSSHWE